MGIDIRLPLGILFSLLGIVLAIYGVIANPSQNLQSLGININLWWGGVLLAFGLLMLMLGRRGMRAAAVPVKGSASTRRGE